MYFIPYFSATYGNGTYNTGTYNGAAVTQPQPSANPGAPGTTGSGSAAGSATGTSTNPLANTGFDLVLGATLGCLIIFSALVIRFWKRPAKQHSASEEA